MTDLKTGTILSGRPGSGAHRVVALCGPYLSGKTSLLESLLYATGAIGRRGSTRAGTSIGDGSLEAREIMKMHLNADLAVLSACETGNGRISPGEGVIGMSWAFFVAGTRSMVVSQWRVDSVSTSQLMKNFYQALARQRNRGHKSEALRETSIRLFKDPRYRHPFYWAGFVFVGTH